MRMRGLFFISAILLWVNISQAQQTSFLVPQGLAALRQSASSKSGFTFDHSMLVLASRLDSNNEDLQRVIAGVSGVSVQQLHFKGEGYDPALLGSVGEEYRSAGWRQLMNDRDKNGVAGYRGLWIRFENNAVTDVAFVIAKPDAVNFITVSGSISPADLSHLTGHFGIPKIEGGVLVPSNPSR